MVENQFIVTVTKIVYFKMDFPINATNADEAKAKAIAEATDQDCESLWGNPAGKHFEVLD